MEITPNLWMIEGPGPCYIYRDSDTYTLIDTGITGTDGRILEYIENVGGKPDQLRQIILTHGHPDHTGGQAGIIEKTGAQVLAHEADIPVIIGDKKFEIPEVPEAEREIMEKLIEATPPHTSAPVDRKLQDGDEIEMGAGARVVHVPGHTPGSIAIYMPEEKLLFTGDAVERDHKENLIVGMFNLNQAQAIESFKKLAELDFEIACLGHGTPSNENASEEFQRLAAKLSEA
jgi:glyoxylase-like metal-dependent hydrolase (beta-lactamase superfamily II)